MKDPFFIISAIVVCSSLLAWLACRVRQPIILAYFLCGVLMGPAGFKLIPNVEPLEPISRIGVALLLFLAGMVLHPDRLLKFFRTASIVTLADSALVWLLVFAGMRLWGFEIRDSVVAGVALMYSSTILVIKLLPTTTLHQQHMGSICIAVLIAEDLIAVLALMFIGAEFEGSRWYALLRLPVMVVLLTIGAVLFEQHIVRRMMRAADRYNEVMIMLCLGWCVGVATLAEMIHVSYEVGAFIAGVSMARGKIALILSEQLKPLRDFFLMFFFFILGAMFDITQMGDIWLPATLLAVGILLIRPLWVRLLLRRAGEEKTFSREASIRLGQASEFSLIIAMAAWHSGHVSASMLRLIQLTTVITMLLSSYLVIFKYPTPLGTKKGLQQI